jgi:hypothetical protein
VAPASYHTSAGGFAAGVKVRFEEVQREYNGLCEILTSARAEGSTELVQMVLQQIQQCVSKGFKLRVGFVHGWEVADMLEEGNGKFSWAEMDIINEARKRLEAQQQLLEGGRRGHCDALDEGGPSKRRWGAGFGGPQLPQPGWALGE